jgi:hypothetical protein
MKYEAVIINEKMTNEKQYWKIMSDNENNVKNDQ